MSSLGEFLHLDFFSSRFQSMYGGLHPPTEDVPWIFIPYSDYWSFDVGAPTHQYWTPFGRRFIFPPVENPLFYSVGISLLILKPPAFCSFHPPSMEIRVASHTPHGPPVGPNEWLVLLQFRPDLHRLSSPTPNFLFECIDSL